jgi:hypothetical protein
VEVFVHVSRLSFRPRHGKPLLFFAGLPMNPAGESPSMQITVTVSDAIFREVVARSLPVIDFVESLIDRGMIAASDPPVLDSAIERIRRLRAGTHPS